jgi:hypothetical protein
MSELKVTLMVAGVLLFGAAGGYGLGVRSALHAAHSSIVRDNGHGLLEIESACEAPKPFHVEPSKKAQWVCPPGWQADSNGTPNGGSEVSCVPGKIHFYGIYEEKP